MKSYLFTAAALALGLTAGAGRAQTRADLEAQFQKCKAASQKALQASPEAVRALRDGGKFFNRDKFNPVVEPTVQTQTGAVIKVYGLLRSGPNAGRLVHLEKYRFSPRERFQLVFESSVPVYVALYQDYLEQPTRKVLPDERFPQSYSVILPGQQYVFPVLLETDDNLHTERMSIAVMVATSTECCLNRDQPNVVVLNPGDNQPVLDKGARRRHADMMARQFAAKKHQAGAKFNPSTQDDLQNPSVRPISDRPDDVSIIAVGRENFAHLQVQLHK
jgi:hypothetical protein